MVIRPNISQFVQALTIYKSEFINITESKVAYMETIEMPKEQPHDILIADDIVST